MVIWMDTKIKREDGLTKDRLSTNNHHCKENEWRIQTILLYHVFSGYNGHARWLTVHCMLARSDVLCVGYSNLRTGSQECCMLARNIGVLARNRGVLSTISLHAGYSKVKSIENFELKSKDLE
ncbi:unnamed protein product [Dovyalis caffra]|uniref:Uncharacterized protein n=1 Tax=Dovyalis caffra TaxID=77055 RepID=A0AAV1QQC7_9ROSI|nr:unnamed protein product [Dovyalis caffra]